MELPLAPQGPAQAAPATLPVIAEHVGLRSGCCGGMPRVLGRRTKGKHGTIRHEETGMSLAEIADASPTITLAARKDHDA